MLIFTKIFFLFHDLLIKKGSKGENVKLVQKVVGAVPDGDFGPGTESKVKAWQKAATL